MPRAKFDKYAGASDKIVSLSSGGGYGPEMFPDGGMSDAVTGWTYANIAGTIVSGALRLRSTVSGVAARAGNKLIAGFAIGRKYEVSIDMLAVGGTFSAFATLRLSATTTAGAVVLETTPSTGAGKRTVTFTATATSHRIQVRFDGSGADTTTYVDLDNASCRMVL